MNNSNGNKKPMGPRQWSAHCEQCGRKFHYSEHNLMLDLAVGQPRPKRCLRCEQLDERGMKTSPLSQAVVSAAGIPERGPLGTLSTRRTPHKPFFNPTEFQRDKFGVKDEELHALYAELQRRDTPVVIAVAPTGSGKSTFLPLRLLSPDGLPQDRFSAGRQIVITQPRRDVTIGIASYVASKLYGAEVGPGHEVGYRVRGQQACDWRNRMTYVTDGSLVNWIARGDLERISLIVIDEAHERSLNIDIILGLLIELLPIYPHLKVLIVSATIDHEKFQRHFNSRLPPGQRCGIVECSGTKPVGLQVHYRTPALPPFPYAPGPLAEFGHNVWQDLADAMVQLIVAMDGPVDQRDPSFPKLVQGDVLGFLHGAKPIDLACQHIRQRLRQEFPNLDRNTDIYAYYAAAPKEERDAAVNPKKDPRRRRVVIASNAAETSLTIESLVHVVDSGVIKQTQWDPVLQEAPLTPVVHSQAGCRQRWGRVGRVAAGFAWCLYSKQQFLERFPIDTTPEIQRSCLDGIVLVAKRSGADRLDGESFAWLDAPAKDELQRSVAKLKREGALDKEEDLTEQGLEIAKTGGEDALYSRLMRDADRFGFGVEAATLIPLLMAGPGELFPDDREWEPSRRQQTRAAQDRYRQAVSDDLELLLRAYQDWSSTPEKQRHDWTQRNGVDGSVLAESLHKRFDLIRQLGAKKKDLEDRPIDFAGLDRLRILIARAFPESICVRDDGASSDSSSVRYRPLDTATETIGPLEISRESCLRSAPPPMLVALGPKKRKSTDDGDVLLIPFVVALDASELERLIRLTDLELALHFQAAHARPRIGSEVDERLQRHQRLREEFPPGRVVRCRVLGRLDDAWEVAVEDSRGWAHRPPEQIDVTGSRRERKNDAREAGFDPRYSSERPPKHVQMYDEQSASIDEGIDTEPFVPRRRGDATRQPSQSARGLMTFLGSQESLSPDAVLDAEVIRHSDLRVEPALILRSPLTSQCFAKFAQTYKVGDDVPFKIMGVAPKGAVMPGLLVRELTTGWETTLPAAECVILDEPGLLDLIPIGTIRPLRILDVRLSEQTADLTALGGVESLLRDLLKRCAEPQSGVIVRVDRDEQRVYVVVDLDAGAKPPGVVLPAKFRIPLENFLSDGVPKIPFVQGQKVYVRVERKERLQSNSPLPGLTANLVALLGKHGVQVQDGRLCREQPLSLADRLALRRSLSSPAWRDAVDELFLSGYFLFGQWVITDLERRFPNEAVIPKARVIDVKPQHVKLALPDGAVGILVRQELSWWTDRVDPREFAEEGRTLSVRVIGVDSQRQTVLVSLKRREAASWQEAVNKQFPLRKKVKGTVAHFYQGRSDDSAVKLAFVNLAPGLDGGLHLMDMKTFHPGYIADVRDILTIGDEIEVEPLEVDPANRKIKLKLIKKLPTKADKKNSTATAPANVKQLEPEAAQVRWPWTKGEDAIVKRERPKPPPPPPPVPITPLESLSCPKNWKLSW